MSCCAGGLTIVLLLIASATANSLLPSKLHYTSVSARTLIRRALTDLVPDDFDSCRVQKLTNPSIRCRDDGSFSPLQCEEKRCWCVHRNGTRFNQMTFPRTDDVSDATCTNGQCNTEN